MIELCEVVSVPMMDMQAIDLAYQMERDLSEYPSFEVETQHTLHDGVYTRTICMAAGTAISGALVRVPTTLIISGDVTMTTGLDTVRINSYRVLAAMAGRKQVFYAHSDTHISMLFATDAKTIEQAESEFTHEADRLASRLPSAINHIVITGE